MPARRLFFSSGCASALFWVLGILLSLGSLSQAEPPTKLASNAWTVDEALGQLALYPSDPYLQYVALQTAIREKRTPEVFQLLERRFPAAQNNGGRSSADLFSTFTGALAVQESLQLDTMRGDRSLWTQPEPKGGQSPPKKVIPQRVSVDKLAGPTVRSHPWAKMLGSKKPEVDYLANCVPEEFYFAEFKSVAKLNDVVGLSELWGGHIFTQALGQSQSQTTVERIKRQLGMFELPPTAIEGLEIEGVAVTGSDLFLAEGSDVTLLIESKKLPQLIKLVDGVLKTRGQWATSTYLDIEYMHYLSKDGLVDVYSATPRPNLHVRGNSLPAFKRVLETVAGKTATDKPARRLGESAEFQYVRTLIPRGAPEEDGLIYLSDSFIRNLVGPRLKLTEQRRMLIYNHLRMIGHAALMFRTETGRAPKSLEELAESGCAPGIFGQGRLAHPDGGTYALTSDGMAGVCSKYGQADKLAPCIEHWVSEAGGEEAQGYRDFVREYNEYWKTYFDPIAIRVKASPKQYRLETLILPLIDNSIYTAMAQELGGERVALDAMPSGQHELAGIWLHFNKQPLLKVLGPEVVKKEEPKPKTRNQGTDLAAFNQLKQLALAMENFHNSTGRFPPAGSRDKKGKSLLSWRVALLPYIEQHELYNEFKLDEPWDSENNKKLIEKMPKIFAAPNQKLLPVGKTTYVVPVGKETIFPTDGEKITNLTISDGTSNTILIVQANEGAAVTWTKPDDLVIDLKNPLRGLERNDNSYFLAAMADGEIKRIHMKVSPVDLSAAFTRNGGEIFNDLDRPAQKLNKSNPEDAPKLTVQFVNDMKQIGLAVQTFDRESSRLPPAALRDKNGKPLLSWRVAILPNLGEGQLYSQFRLDEAWDSEHNKKLIPMMPRIYKGFNRKLNENFKTNLLVPVGDGTTFPPTDTAIKFADIADGTASTIMVLAASDEAAVVWTKPDDLSIDLKNPLKGLDPAGFLALMADGSVRRFGKSLSAEKMAALLTRAGGEDIDINADEDTLVQGGSGTTAANPFSFMLSEVEMRHLEDLGVDMNKLRRFLRDGIGDQIGLQMHDASKLFDFDASSVLGGRGPNSLRLPRDQAFGLGMAVQVLTGPFSISMPVKNRKVVDEFLDELDGVGQKLKTSNFWPDEDFVEFYRMPFAGPHSIRCMAIKFIGLKWRLYWGRIGDGLYIANRPFILEDLAAAQAGEKPPTSISEPAHALLKLRPKNWKQVMPVYNLSWAEANRTACHNNLSMLANVNRGWNDRRPKGNEPDKALMMRVARLYGTRPFCPDGGNYILSENGKDCKCSIHGNALDSRQLAAPTETSPTGRLLKNFNGMSAGLNFSADCLRVVVTIDRKE